MAAARKESEAENERLRADVEAAQTLAGTYEEENERLRVDYALLLKKKWAADREVERLQKLVHGHRPGIGLPHTHSDAVKETP
jgi:predicted nuclease with TOPRIM domain